MRTGKAEIGENAIAHELGHKAVVAGDDARAGVLIGADDTNRQYFLRLARNRRQRIVGAKVGFGRRDDAERSRVSRVKTCGTSRCPPLRCRRNAISNP